MARVTVEDCVEKIPNRFDLVLSAAQRARQIGAGAPILVERDNDKNPIVALREIAEDHVHDAVLKEALISGFRKHFEAEPQEEEFAQLFEEEASRFAMPSTQGISSPPEDNAKENFDEDDEDFSSEDSE